ncbi:MAG: hypothetical protein KM312_08000 [Hydrogenibacillus schlegelii]|uniref:Uncharacterized protein n=1 Tax=Hydrogenibacillus schlegelii TaxID=1484 RepID=A0A947GHD5_HYDSH|nr:hypothetical protein [Hydrogenibacillus schlegelii]
MFDVIYDPEAHRILDKVYDSGGIVAAECHCSSEYFPVLDRSQFAVWVDEWIVTSRDPASSILMAEELVKALTKRAAKRIS